MSLGLEDKTKIVHSLLKTQGAITLIDNGVALVSLHVSNDGGEGIIQVVDAVGNRIEIARITQKTDYRDISFGELQMFWKNSELRIIKSNSKGELLVTARYVKGVKLKMLDWNTWSERL